MLVVTMVKRKMFGVSLCDYTGIRTRVIASKRESKVHHWHIACLLKTCGVACHQAVPSRKKIPQMGKNGRPPDSSMEKFDEWKKMAQERGLA